MAGYALNYVSIGGVERAFGRSGYAGVQIDGFTINDSRTEPNTCVFKCRGFQPIGGQEVLVRFGSTSGPDGERTFAGSITNVTRGYFEKPTDANMTYDVSAIDWDILLEDRVVMKEYTDTVYNIVVNLMATYAPAFTCNNVEAISDVITIAFEPDSTLRSALRQLANRIEGDFYTDYQRDLHFFITETGEDPAPLVPNSSPPVHFADFNWREDISQWITRAFSWGGGGNASTNIPAGSTDLPVTEGTWYPLGGGIVRVGHNRIRYASASLGGGGSLVGPGASPAAAPAVGLAYGSGISNGVRDYAVTFVTAAGESKASPVATLTTANLAAPSAALNAGTATSGSGPDAGSHDYVVTNLNTGGGETTVGPISSATTTGFVVADPSIVPTASDVAFPGALTVGGTYQWVYTFKTATGETAPSPLTSSFVTATGSVLLTGIPYSTNVAVTHVRVFRSAAGPTLPPHLVINQPNNTAGGTWNFTDQSGSDAVISGNPTPPSSNSTGDVRVVPLSNIPLGPTGTTSRKIYRRFNGTGNFKLVTTLANNTATTYSDTVTNASLGANAPSSNTASMNQTAISSIPIGSSSVTARKIYRTAASGSQLKLVATISDNSTTTYTDSTADGSLGANVPTSDTSGLAQVSGQVIAGSTSMLVAGTSWASSSGGWVVIGNGQQYVRYSGISGSSLTGIPASGVGAIVASVSYGSPVTATPLLSGIPSSGDGSIVYDVIKGDEVSIGAQVDDLDGRALLAARLSTAIVTGVSATNPAVIETQTDHGFTNGQTATITGTFTTPSVNGQKVVTVIDDTHFSVPVNVSAGQAFTSGTVGWRDGLVENSQQDGRISYEECLARATARLRLKGRPDYYVSYESRDLPPRSGRTIAVDLPEPIGLTGRFRIDSVTISEFSESNPNVYPKSVITAVSTPSSFEGSPI